MQLISREQAQLSRITKYFTGRPCKHGHISERWVSNQVCISCRKPLIQSKKAAARDIRSQAFEDNQLFYFTGVPCKHGHISIRRTSNKMCVECDKHSNSLHVKNNRGKRNSQLSARRALQIKATPKWSNLGDIKTLYEGAEYLTRLTGIVWHVDHVMPLRNKQVCGLHVYENLQLLTATDNLRKSNKLTT